jgi:thiol-disulfide isomerase/thioredoxin
MPHVYRCGFFCIWVSLVLTGVPGFAQSGNPVQSLPFQQVDDIVRRPGYTLVVIMAAWCHPCIEELPSLNALDQKYRRQGLRTLGISLDYAGPKAMQPIIDKLKIGFPVYWAGEAAIDPYAITKIPLLLFVRDGQIVRRMQGARDKATFEKEIVGFLGDP